MRGEEFHNPAQTAVSRHPARGFSQTRPRTRTLRGRTGAAATPLISTVLKRRRRPLPCVGGEKDRGAALLKK
ncbi:hypothetical protein SRHO_G00033220 [Serrasalmus rhombeus]